MKNIAFVIPDLQSGGSERVSSYLSRMLSDEYNCHFLVFDRQNIKFDTGVTPDSLELPPVSSKAGKVINYIKRVRGTNKYLRDNNIDTAISYTTIANRILASTSYKCRKFVSCRGYASLAANPAEYRKFVKKGCDILFNARRMESCYLDKYPGDSQRVHTIMNIIDRDGFIKKAAEPLPEEYKSFFETHRVISTIGIISRPKGHWNLIKSFEILKDSIPDAGLVIIGSRGKYEQEVMEMASRSKYSGDILFTGFQDNPYKFVSRSEIYAMCSLNEGYPNAMIEAMMAGVPPVSTNCLTGPDEILYKEYKVRDIKTFEYADRGVITAPFGDEVNFNSDEKNELHRNYAAAMVSLMNNSEKKSEYSQKNLEYTKMYSAEVLRGEYISVLSKPESDSDEK